MWVYRYTPKSLEDIPQDTSKLKSYISAYSKQKKKAVLLHGPPGSCKTSAVHTLAKDMNMELVEINASDYRTADEINSRLGNAVKQMSLFSQGKLIFVDEADGVSGRKDRGGVKAIIDIISKSTFPVVIAANDAFDDKLKTLQKKCETIEFPAVTNEGVTKVLSSVFSQAGIDVDERVIKSIARRSGGDLRGAIIDSQVLAHSDSLTSDGVHSLSDRERSESIMNALMRILKTTDPSIAISAFDSVDGDFDEFLLWLDENVPKEYSGRDLARAYDKISRADVFRGRIRRWQYWGYLRYINALLTAGIAVSKDQKKPGMTQYKRNSRLLKIWLANRKYAKRKSIAQKLGSYCHCSSKKALQFLPLLKPAINDELALELGLDEEELGWLQK